MMATNQKEREMGGEVAEEEQQEEDYEQKFQEMQKYIPFLEMMIQKLERSSDKSREAQLLKMKSLLSILSNTKKKLKISTLKRCEDVLQKLHEKVEKGINAQNKPSSVKPEVQVTTNNSQETSNSGISENAASSGDGNEEHSVTSATGDRSVTNIMETLRLAAARTSGKNMSPTASCPANGSDREDNRVDCIITASSNVDKMSSPEKKSKAVGVLEQSRERLKKLMEQQITLTSAESDKKSDGHSGSLPLEWQYQADPPWKSHDNEKRAPKSAYSHNTIAGDPVEGCSSLEQVKDITSRDGSQYRDGHYNSVDSSRSHKHDELYTSQSVWPSDSEQHENTNPNKPSLSPAGLNRVPTSPNSPTSLQSVASNSGRQTCTSPVKRTLPQFPTLYNVLKHPPAAGSKPLSDADIEELLEDTKRSESEPENKEEPMHMSLRAKLEQEIQQVHRVGVSKGGALRSLVQKDEKLKSPVRNILDVTKPNFDLKKDRLITNQQSSSKSDSVTESALKVNHDKEKRSDITQSRQNSGRHFAEKGDNKSDFGNVNDTVTKPTIKDKRPADPRRHTGFSPRREEVCQNSSGEEVHPAGENYPHLRLSADVKSSFDDSGSSNRDVPLHGKCEGITKKEGAGILSSLSKAELQKIVEENLRNLPSPPPNTKEILETVNMNSCSAMKSSWQQSADFLSQHPSPVEYNQSGFMSPVHSSQYGSQAESHLGNGRNSASYSSPFGVTRPEDRRGLLPTPNVPHDPRVLPRNLNQDPRCSRENQGVSNFHDPRLNTPNYPHLDSFRSGISQHSSHDQYIRPVPSAFHQNSRTHFRTNQSLPLQASSRWGRTPCYGILSHNSPRPPDDSFVHPEDSYPHHGANSSRFQCSPHSSQHEFRQIHSLHDQFSDTSANNQQNPSWQSPPSSQGFRSGSSSDYPSCVRSVGQPVQHHGNNLHNVSKIPVGDPRLSNQFTGHRSPVTPQSATSDVSSRSLGGAGTHSYVQSTESRSANTLSERDPRRRRSIEEPEKRDCSSRTNRDNRKVSSSSRGSNYGHGPDRVSDRHSLNDRRRESESRKFESSSGNRRRSSPEPNNPKETELVSPLNSLYDVATVPKTGKGYGFQKFRIPKIKRPPSPPKSKSPPPPKAKSPPPKLETSHLCDNKEKVELVKSSDETPLIKTDTVPCGVKDGATNDAPDIDADGDDRSNVECIISKKSENTLLEKSSDIESEKMSPVSRSKEEVAQEWIEALIRKSFESGEGKKFIEQAKLLEKLGESLKGKKLRKIKQILESDSESDGSVEGASKKKTERTHLEKEDQKLEEKDKLSKKVEISVEQSKKSKCQTLIFSDDDQSTDSETLASRLKKKGIVEGDRSFSAMKGKGQLEKEDKSSGVDENGKPKKKKQSVSTDGAKPVRKYSKRRSALELLQEDIRDMFICEGVVTATGHRMCRLLKETRPGMTVDEISKSALKRTEDEVSTAAEESDGSSVCKRRSRKLLREKEFDKKGREEKVHRKQKMKVRMKDEETDGGFEVVNLVDESDSAGSPVTKPPKKYEKCKWKGYVIEESDDSNEDVVDESDDKAEVTDEMKEITSCDKPQEWSCSHGRAKSKFNPTDDSETTNLERRRRTRLPRVLLEKTDFSKLSPSSSKPRTRYIEDSSSDGESVRDEMLTAVCSGKSRYKVVQKSRAKAKHVLHKRGRQCVSKRGRKKCLTIDRNDEASTDVESIVSEQSSIASTVSHQTNCENVCSPVGFTFRKKYVRRRSKFLEKKIDDVIKRLRKDIDGCKVTEVTVNMKPEGKPSESGKIDLSVEEGVAESASAGVKEKENIVKCEGTSEQPAANKCDVHLAKPDMKTESIGASSVGRKRHSRVMLNLVRKFRVQKKVKKKKTKWQLGIINSTKKKGGIKVRTQGGTKDVIVSNSEKEENELQEAVSSTNPTDECNSTRESEVDVSTSVHIAEDDNLGNSKQDVIFDDSTEKKIDMKQVGAMECSKKDVVETNDVSVNRTDVVVVVVGLESVKTVARSSKVPTVDRSYVLDGRPKYACKLCPVQCKGIVSHYKNCHQESEVLISRLPEEESTRAIAEACESNYKEEEVNTKPGKRTRKQAGTFVCRVCDYSATYAVNFYEHLSSHTGEYRFKCGQCQYEAPIRHYINGHFNYHHPELKGIDAVNVTVLAPGPPNDAKFVFGYLCSSCNYIQLLKHNIERHIALKHTSESNTKFICINMSKVIASPIDIAKCESNVVCTNVCTDEGTSESSGYVGDKVSLGDDETCNENVCNVISPIMKTEMTPGEGIKSLGSTVTRINVTEQEPRGKYTDKSCDTVDESMGKEQTSDTEPLGVVCVTQSEISADSCTLASRKLSDTTAEDEKSDTVSKEKPDAGFQEVSALNCTDVAMKAGDAKLPSEIAKEDIVDVEGRQMKQKIDGSMEKGAKSTDTTIVSESSMSGVEEAVKEVDLKAFVCCDDLEEENSVIQKERLKKMQEIAKNLKDRHPQFLQSNRSSIIDHLSDKLKTCFRSRMVDTAIGEKNETLDSVTNIKESECKGIKSQTEILADMSTLIDEKRAIEAAQAVQNLLRAEKETVEHEQSSNTGRKITESFILNRSGRHTKSCSSDTLERRITRSFSKNEDDVDIVDVDESSSDISFGFEGEDNEEIAESESQSPETLLTETLSALKDVGPKKTGSRMFDIIERLASKVVPKTESADVGDRVVEMGILKPHSNVIATDDNVCSNKEFGLETNETGCLKNAINKKLSGVIGRPPPLISIETKKRNVLRSISVQGNEGSVSSIRVGPLEVRRFSDGLLYSCCIRGCIFASTNRTSFASHIELSHKVSRWDGSCRACHNRAKGDRPLKLSHALRHLTEFHIVTSPNDLTTSLTSNINKLDVSTSAEKTCVEEREVSAENTGVRGGEISAEQIPAGQGNLLTEETYLEGEELARDKSSVEQEEIAADSTSVREEENCNRNGGVTEASTPRTFIRLRRLSGDLLSIPKPAEDPVMTDAQQQAFHKDDMEVNHLISEWSDAEANNEEDTGPFLKIESVVSLNPEAMGTEDVNEILKAVEDPQNSSKSPEKSYSRDFDNVVTSSSSSSLCAVSSGASIIESPIPFVNTAAGSSTNILQTSSTDVQLLSSSSSSSSSSSALPLSLLRGKTPLPPGTMHMIPVTQLPKSSTITILPSLQPVAPVKLSNVQLSAVKLANFKSPDITSKPSVATNIPHSLVGLAQITRPANSKATVARERLATGVVGGGVWCNQVVPNLLPKGTFVRLEIKDRTKTPMVLTTKSQAPVMVNVKAAPSLTMTTKTTSSIPKVPIPSVSVMKGLEFQAPATKTLQKGKSSSGGLLPPPVPVSPASNTVLTTVISKNKLPHKSAVAPSYAKASKVPSAYQEMIKSAKLRHLYKCMGRLCSYTTDSMKSFAKHYNEHEIQLRQQLVAEKKRGRPPASKMSDWQQCAYCCAMHTSFGGVLCHIQTEHAHCLYQCAYCFYRAVTKSYVILHQNTSHTSERVAVLMCKEIRSELKPASVAKCRSSVIVPYVCEQGSCGATFYIPDSFLRHLEKEHSQLSIYSCHICRSKSFKPDRLLAHYKLHSCCFYQCMYCIHGTDTKEEMHHHLCNFHSNQPAKVIIRAASTSVNAVSRGSRDEQELLEALKVLDLDEGLSDDGVLVLPPPEKERTPEDCLADTNITHPEVQDPSCSNITKTGMTTKEVASNEGTVNAVSTISSELCNIRTDLLLKELSKETKKCDNENLVETSDSVSGIRHDDKIQNCSPSASGLGNVTEDDDDVDGDVSGVSHSNDCDMTCTQPVQPITQQNSHAVSELCLQPSGTNPSQSKSDVECIVKPCTSQQDSKQLNEIRESDVIVLDSTTDTESEGTEIMGKDLAMKANSHLILPEPMVTVKHRNPETSAAIAAAVDPLSLELSENEAETSNVTSSLQSTSSISLCAENPHLCSENINSMVSSSETGLSDCSTTGMDGNDDDDDGLSGSMLYQCGYVTCTFTAEDSSLLKDHLLVCDLARDSSSLTCVHCKKQFKYVNSLLEHLRTHGTRRFSCSLCSFRAPASQQVVKHLKQRHRVGSTRIAPHDPLRTDPETAMFVVFPKDKGRGGRKGSGKDTQGVRSKSVFLPEEVETLPRQAIYTRPVQCATCSYTTKVRSNMARHLHLHLTSNSIPDVTPPNNAPVNPVPCLDKKEMMFDKMTNLAASSHIGAGAKTSETPSGSLTLTEEVEAKLPKFVPEHQRYVCGAPGCSYLTCDETMLRYHLRALHFDETAYRCPHCPASSQQENMSHVVSIERMGAHLKMHDSRLYKCAHCMYHHFQRYVVERHLADKHPEKRPFVHVVREPDVESGNGKTEAVPSTSLEEAADLVGAGAVKNPWRCGLCKFHCSTRSEVLEHTWGVHGLKSQFKCGLCSYRSSSKASFDAHFGSKHPGTASVELIHVYFKVDAPQISQSPAAKCDSSVDVGTFDTTPLWRRDMQRVRHIRGILLEEEGDIPKPDVVRRSSIDFGMMEETEGKFGPYGKPIRNLYFCTLCNKYRTKFKADFRDHLYRELSYHKWVCTHCSMMSCNKSTLQKHSAKVHEKDRKPEAIAPLTPNEEIEDWVDKVISTQLAMMKADQHATSGDSASSSSKVSGTSFTNMLHPGPSGVSGKGSKVGHGVPGSGGKVSMLEKEDVVLSSSCGDTDIDMSKKKVLVMQDVTSVSPLDSETYLYTKMKAASDEVKVLRFPCKHCNMKFAQIRGLKVHIRHNHLKLSIWTCGHCGYVANSEEGVLNHSKIDHPDLSPRSLPHTKGSCVKLDDEFWQREYGLGQGSESKHPSSSLMTLSSSSVSSPVNSPVKKRQRSASPSDDSEGSLSLVSLADRTVNKCVYCDYCSRSVSDLKYHVMRHWVQKPFKCGYCDFEGVREYEIKKHSAKVHPLKKLRVVEKPMPSQPDIRPLQRNKRSKPDSPGCSSGVSITEIGQEKVVQCDESQDTDVVSTVHVSEDEQQNVIAVPNLFCCFYCPQRGTSVVSIHQHWQEKHKNKLMGSNGVKRLGLPFKYKEVNIKQFLKGKNAAAGRRPAFQCSYCKVRGTLSMLESHQKIVHSDKPFRVSEARFTHYECAECHYVAFTVSTLKRHFEIVHAGIDLRYLVKSSKASVVPDMKSNDLLAADKSLGLPGPSSVVTAKYMCLWCEETCDSEDTIQVHHAMCHSHLQLKYSVEKSSTSATSAINIGKKYSCPSCPFMSDSGQNMSEHLQQHVKPCKTDYKASGLSSKNHNHALIAHAEDCEVSHIEDAEKQLEKLISDSGINVGGDSVVKHKPEVRGIALPAKRLCVARKSTTLSPRIGKFHLVARKSTTPLPSQTASKTLLESFDVEQGDTSAPSSRSESPVIFSEFSYYGTCPTPVDTNRITASVKLRNNLGVNMNMSLATMEKLANLYPLVKVKDLKYEKWGFL